MRLTTVPKIALRRAVLLRLRRDHRAGMYRVRHQPILLEVVLVQVLDQAADGDLARVVCGGRDVMADEVRGDAGDHDESLRRLTEWSVSEVECTLKISVNDADRQVQRLHLLLHGRPLWTKGGVV